MREIKIGEPLVINDNGYLYHYVVSRIYRECKKRFIFFETKEINGIKGVGSIDLDRIEIFENGLYCNKDKFYEE